MEYEGVNSVICDAEENDWLDISYTERKYLNEETPVKRAKKRRAPAFFKNKTVSKVVKYVAAGLVSAAAVVGLLFVDSNFEGNVFETARATYSSNLAIFGGTAASGVNKITLPYTITLENVEGGVVVFSGGRAVVSFTDGVVKEVTENSVTVEVDDKTSIVYSDLTATYVAAGDEISANTLIAKYDGSAKATIVYDGEIVEDVIGSEYELQWSV